ncbi:hypothetical protein TRIUR3_18913 [Triticum urartu]|uniref:F-box domain-containing protein n=1 Tax=Triticum urartu TaxID=4572 RepID=M8AFL5_TRIUA|nr:hypothetical protein TRIUR3_18913 [Triticum urartu]
MHRKFSDGEDRIGALHDDVLLHLMSFLPSQDAVRTCVLAKRWRTLWKSVPTLRIKDDPDGYRVCECMDETDHDGMDQFDYVGERPAQTRFVDDLLSLRDPTPLNAGDEPYPSRQHRDPTPALGAGARHMGVLAAAVDLDAGDIYSISLPSGCRTCTPKVHHGAEQHLGRVALTLPERVASPPRAQGSKRAAAARTCLGSAARVKGAVMKDLQSNITNHV